ncbi:MAG TPA: ABC transporter ATP-binding protein [Acidimicrobiales bacterium]|jgi:NitT/TauT family transport system ATP-binding protein|nr:ABC transporter ATP-binding protein [Acidimicrobiales bacterium]
MRAPGFLSLQGRRSPAGLPGATASPAGIAGPSGEGAPLLSVEHVQISYRLKDTVVQAVGDASFEIMPEEKVMLIGPTGCGKSTILKAVAGFLEPVSGQISFAGSTDVSPRPDRAVVFQEFDQLFPWRNVLENVAYPLRVTGRSKSEALAQATSFIDMVGLAHATRRFPHQLSGGMKQRVAIARALALGPPLLLMDEPFGSLDAITRGRLQRDLNRLAEQARVALLFVTHSIDEALVLGHRVVVLNGSPSTVAAVVDVADITSPEDDHYKAVHGSLEELLGGAHEEVGNGND